jgi:hypothetical protein
MAYLVSGHLLMLNHKKIIFFDSMKSIQSIRIC